MQDPTRRFRAASCPALFVRRVRRAGIGATHSFLQLVWLFGVARSYIHYDCTRLVATVASILVKPSSTTSGYGYQRGDSHSASSLISEVFFCECEMAKQSKVSSSTQAREVKVEKNEPCCIWFWSHDFHPSNLSPPRLLVNTADCNFAFVDAHPINISSGSSIWM